jgi:streptogramin lyase
MKHKLTIAVAVSLLSGMMLSAQSPAPVAGTVLTGTVKSPSGQPLEGMVISARQQGKTIKTSVFTDEQGLYFFPSMEKGTYDVWAQAVGFNTARASVQLDGASTRRDFGMTTLADFSLQLSGAEWLASLPAETAQDARMKEVFRTNCAGCHAASWVLQNKFDRDGWFKIITNMERISIQGGGEQRVDATPQPWLRFHKDELADYLAKVRGPNSKLNYKVLPRPKGESARAVITEYDTGSSEDPTRPVRFDGSDWSQGIPTAYEARGPHDADVDPQGFVWIVYGDDGHPAARTYGRLDPKTGKLQDFKVTNETGDIQGSHGVKVDEQGRVWFNAGGNLQMVDSKDPSLKLQTFVPPDDMGNVGGHIQISPQGYIWATSDGGIMYDPATQKWRRFDHPHDGGNTYGVGADSDGNGWWAQMGGLPYDELGKGDLNTGKSVSVPMEPVAGMKELATPADMEFYRVTGSQTNMAPMWAEGPRRMMGDKIGNMWVSNWWGNNLAQVDIKTLKVTYRQYPNKEHVGLYQPVPDKNNMVWVNLMTADRVARYDPRTNSWTEILLPNRGTETRHMAVDNFKPQVEGWTPYWRTNQMARIQLRSQQDLDALKKTVAGQ